MAEETEEYENHEEGKSSISADLIRGHINTIILRSLYDRDKYGYEIINEINEKSHGQYTLKQPTLYSALKRLENQGYIQAYWKSDEVSSGGRRKYFRLTDSGKEITEKNQAEWEYSRTVIDNLISDKNFDFSQPAPTPVDFKYLKQSTSRVPIVRTEDGEGEENSEEEKQEKEPEEKVVVLAEPVIEAVTFTAVHETSVILEPEDVSEEVLPAEEKPEESAGQNADGQEVVVQQTETIQEVPPQPVTEQPPEQPQEQEKEPEPEQSAYTATLESVLAEEERRKEIENAEEQRRIAHENYVKLISGELSKKPEQAETEDKADTENIIYNNKPETERDYRNLIDRLFENSLRPAATAEPVQEQQPVPEYVPEQPPVQVYTQPVYATRFGEADAKAANDGIRIYQSGNTSYAESARQSTYNKGATLFKCSLIVGVIILLEFTLCLLFKDSINVSYAYPFIILALGLADILVCGILYGAGYGKQVRKPTSLRYIITSIVVTAILILVIILFAIVLSVNWSSIADVLAKVIIPCIVLLNIPIFTLSFYILTK